MQNNRTLRYHFSSIRLTKIQKFDDISDDKSVGTDILFTTVTKAIAQPLWRGIGNIKQNCRCTDPGMWQF